MRMAILAFSFALAAAGAAAAQDGAAQSFWADIPYPDGAACEGVRFETAVQPGGDYAGMDFANAVWIDLDLSGADFSGADLTGAALCGVDLTDATLDGADLTGARIENSRLTGVYARGAILDGATVLASELGGDFTGARLREARVLCDASMVHTSCAPTQSLVLDGADLGGAQLAGLGEAVSLDGARMYGATADYLLVPAINRAQFDIVRLAPAPLTDHPAEPFSPGEIASLASGWDERAPVRRAGPGFDCDAAQTDVELALCFDTGLAALDAVMSRLYANAREAGAPGLLDAQRAWLAEREACMDDPYAGACLQRIYVERIEALMPQAPLELPSPGHYRPAVSFAWAPVSAAGTGLGARFAALMENTSDTLDLSFPDEETFHAEGFALGANGHSCSLSQDLLGDPDIGAYRNRIEDPDFPEEEVRIVPLGDLVWFSGGRAWCGMRAGWPDMWVRAGE